MKYLILMAATLTAGCNSSETAAPTAADSTPETQSAPAPTPAPEPEAQARSLQDVLDAQPEDVRARYDSRHPLETLEFFGIEPGMNVVEALPGGGWYSKILIDFIGPDGSLTGADYAQDMWPLFGFFDDEFIAAKATWVDDWTADARTWVPEGAHVEAFVFGSLGDNMAGQADAVLFVRALHNLARFEEQGGFLTAALADAFTILKPGGVVGVVQHEARADMPDDFATGSRGYLKRDFVIAAMQSAGFQYEGAIEVNRNPDDQPTVDDVVWRLPPTLATSREDPELREQLQAVGESNRMTLKFRKPSA